MLYKYETDELRSYCRSSIESMELWARRLIHEKLSQHYGEAYFNAVNERQEPIIKKVIRQKAERLMREQPKRFNRLVDTLFVDDIVYFLCHPSFYKPLFKEALDDIYPQGNDECREYLSRIVPIRNALSHANPISIRQAEQAICYSNDFVEGLKMYYEKKGEERIWNVPQIVKLTDSTGKIYDGTNSETGLVFHVGETYSVTAEIDVSFPRDSYKVSWLQMNGLEFDGYSDNNKLILTFTEADVRDTLFIRCNVTSNKTWHKRGYYDDEMCIWVTVLPPID